MRVVRWARLEACATCGLPLGAWDPVAGPARASREVPLPPWTTLAPDRRMTRRRVPADRRAHLERRIAERRVLPSAVMRPERRIAQRRGILNRRSGRERRGGIERRQRAAGW